MKESQFRIFVIRPTLITMGMWSASAEELLLATAVHESGGLEYLDQVTGPNDTEWGPAYGPFQIEEATHDDIWRYLKRRDDIAQRIYPYIAPHPHRVTQLATNLCYATAIARVKYWMVPEALPAADDLEGIARYWKVHWNTHKGRGTVEKFIADYRRWVG